MSAAAADAALRDAADPLAFARARFRLPEGLIYLDGNSLGPLPADAPERVAAAVEAQWGADLIASWNVHGWIDAPKTVAAKLAPILGSRPDELLIADSTSVCLWKLLAAAVAARPGRSTLLVQDALFPTDAYVAAAVAAAAGMSVRKVAAAELAGAFDETVAAALLTDVDYRTAHRLDMPALDKAADVQGALIVWDLSHSAGAVAHDLNGSGTRLAVGCGYKYLNGGPGAPAFLHVAADLQERLQSPLPGWMGHAAPFAFEPSHRPAPGIARFLTGTPPILALAALDAGLDTFAGVGMKKVEAKSRALSELFIAAVEAGCGEAVRLASPRDPAERGSHVSFAHPGGYAVMQALITRGVVGDFRAPDLMRFGFAPLYTRFADVVRAAEILADLLATGSWDAPEFHARRKVT